MRRLRNFLDLAVVIGFVPAVKYKLGIAVEGKDFW